MSENLESNNFLPKIEMPENRIEYIRPKVEKQIEMVLQSTQNGAKIELNNFPTTGDAKNLIYPYDLYNPTLRKLFFELDTDDYENFFLPSNFDHKIILAQNAHSLFKSGKPMMLVNLEGKQTSPFDEYYNEEVFFEKNGFYTIAEDFAQKNYTCILNGLGAGSIADLHIQMLPPDLIEQNNLEAREYESQFVLGRLEALNYMNWCWQNGVYAVARVLGNNSWAVCSLSNSQGKSISIHSEKENNPNCIYTSQLEQEDLIKTILTFIYNPGGIETNVNNVFSRQNAIEMYKKAILESSWEKDIKHLLLAEIESINNYQRILDPVPRQKVLEILNINQESNSDFNKLFSLVLNILRKNFSRE
jgi:hypothetical protein